VAVDEPNRLLGISVSDLLRAHQRLFDEESRREQFYGPKRSAPRPRAE
jgi:hypothetical protein